MEGGCEQVQARGHSWGIAGNTCKQGRQPTTHTFHLRELSSKEPRTHTPAHLPLCNETWSLQQYSTNPLSPKRRHDSGSQSQCIPEAGTNSKIPGNEAAAC